MTVESTAGRIVGRDAELAELEAALEGLGAGAATCVAIEGEPGIGKTRLLGELRRRAEERGHLVLAGSAAEFERELPFSVWADALDAHVASREPGADEAELAGILPSLGGEAGSLADERYRAHRAMRRLLADLAAPRPLVLVLDDLHWSDDASIELLAALLRRAVDGPVLFALAFRPGRAAGRLSCALTAPSCRRIALGALDEAAATELLRALDPQSTAAVYLHGGGNPFYLEQLAQHGGGDGLAPAPGRSSAGVPAAVAASLAAELASLSEDERTLLRAAAVAGEPFDPDLAAAIAELPAPAALTALDALLALDLVRHVPEPRRFVFRHPLVRQAVYESAPGGWRLAAHARAAGALAGRGAAAAEQAHHVEHSAVQGDEDAIALLLRAGHETTPGAPATAAHWYEAALRLLPAGDRDRQVEALVALAQALRSLGELERCRATLLQALGLVPPGAVAQRVELTARCAALEHWLGRHDDAHRRLARAWEDLSDQTTPAAAALQIELAIDGLYEMDFAQATAMGRGALDAARAAGDDALIAAAAAALSLCEVAAGNTAAALDARAEALALVERLSDAELAAQLETLYYLGWAENYLEHYDAAVAHIDRGIAIARASGVGRLLVPLMLVEGYTFEMLGRVGDAITQCESATESARLSSNPHHLFWALFELAFAHYHAGDLEAAIAAGEESARVGGRLGGATMPAGGGGPGWVLGMAHFEVGEVDRAWQIMHGLGGDDLEHKIPVERCFDWEVLGLVELARGDRAAAEEYFRRTEEHAATLGLRLPGALALRGRAAALLADGDAAGAAGKAMEAAELARAAGARLPAAFALALAGKALAAAGDRKRAIEVLRTAEAELDACSSLRVRDETRRELRRLGARAEPRGPASVEESGLGALTGRELEIAELVTDRRTNREIAAALFLSEKTIESHLRNIFVKLGASSRVQVARAVERERRTADR